MTTSLFSRPLPVATGTKPPVSTARRTFDELDAANEDKMAFIVSRNNRISDLAMGLALTNRS